MAYLPEGFTETPNEAPTAFLPEGFTETPNEAPIETYGTFLPEGFTETPEGEDTYAGMISDSVWNRIYDGWGLGKAGLMSIAQPLDEGLIPENQYMAEGVRGPANILAGVIAAPLGLATIVTSPLAPFGDGAAYVAEEGVKSAARQAYRMRDGNLRNYSEEEQANVAKYAGYAGMGVGILSEALLGSGAMKAYMGLSKKFITGRVAAATKADEFAASAAARRAGNVPETPGGIHPNQPRLPGIPEEGVSGGFEKSVASSFDEAIDAGQFTSRGEGQRLFEEIGENLANGNIIPEQWPPLREKLMRLHGFTQAEADIAIANEFMKGMSAHGRGLNLLSQLRKKLDKVMGDEGLSALDDLASESARKAAEESLPSMLYRGFGKMEQKRRGLLVTQISTAARNFTEQAARFSVATVTDAMEGVLRLPGATLKGKPMAAFEPLFDDFIALGNRLRPSQRNALADVMEAMPTQTAKLMGRPVGEVVMPKGLVHSLNFLNRKQEHFYRKIGFEARFRANLNKLGMKLEDLDLKKLADDVLDKRSGVGKAVDDAVEHALDITYARSPGSAGSAEILRALNSPLVTALGNPYPRFWMNSMKYLHEYSPLGIGSLITPANMAKMASKDYSMIVPIMAKSMVGNMMLGAAGAIRESQYGENRPWYEINTGDGKVIDARPFGATGRYLFLWDAIFHPDRLKPADYFEAMFITGRVTGTGLMFADMIRAKDKESAVNNLKKMVGQYAGGFTTPARILKDWISVVNEEEGIERSTREDLLTGSFRRNIPFVSQSLPERRTIYDVGPKRTENPLFRQMTGIPSREKSNLEREVDNLQVDYQSIYPRTGNAIADRLIVREMGPIIRRMIVPYIESDEYKILEPEVKKMQLKEYFSAAREAAELTAIRKSMDDPKERAMFEKLTYEKGIEKDERAIIEKREELASPTPTKPRSKGWSGALPQGGTPKKTPTQPTTPGTAAPPGRGLVPNPRTREIQEYLGNR